ncbi:MAG: DinB family protein [Candidatus Acidiferrales bacterium]
MENLSKIYTHLEKSEAFYLSAVAKVPDDRWFAPPARGGWSAGEISAHVVMIEERILSRTAKICENPPVSLPFWKRFHLPVSLGTSRRRRVVSTVPLDPSMVAAKEASVARVSAARVATFAFLKSLAGRDLRGYRFAHPFLGSFGIQDWFYFIGYHQIRHAKQILEQVETFQR